ncbi:MAG: alpha/beta fold hydrolase [Rhizobiaceae bacterium]
MGDAPSSRKEEIVVRGVRHSVRKWGRDGARPIVFLHGTQDSSITFQFLAEHLRGDWCVIAPDWRGHGHSQWVTQGYWFHEFVADLDALLDALLPGIAVPLVGHSLGGNIAGVYAGLVPDRVTHLISLDGFGPLTNLVPVDMRKIMTRLLSIPKSDRDHRSYPSIEAVAERLMRGNARITRAQALFLADHATSDDGGGGRKWLFDPTHQMALPTLHSMEEWGHAWSAISAPALWISSEDKRPFAATAVSGEIERRAGLMPEVRLLKVTDTGHNLHHDAPALMAALVELFIVDPRNSLFSRGTVSRDEIPGDAAGESSVHR